MPSQMPALSAADEFQYQLDLYRASNIGGVYTVRMDEQFTLLYGNDLYFQVHEYAPEELLGKSCTLFIHPQDLAHVHAVLANARERRIKSVEWEMRIITGKQNLKYMLVSGSFNTRGGEEVFDGYITDISKSKEMERKLQESEEKFRIATENSDIAFWTYDFGRKEIIQNNSSQKVHGHPTVVTDVPESLLASGYIRYDSSEQFRKMYADLKNGAKTAGGDFWTRNLAGDGWWCERIKYTTVFDEDGKPRCAHAIGRDVTAEKIKENSYNEELSYKDALVSQDFIGSMRADLSTGNVEEIVSPYLWFKQIYGEKNFDECTATLGGYILGREQRANLLSAIQADTLRKDFKNGTVKKTFRVQREMEPGIYKWTSLTVKLFQKPGSGHIVAFLYSYDINREEIFKLAMERIASNNYDMIGCINGVNDTYTMLSSLKDASDFTDHSYERAMAAFLHKYDSGAALADSVNLPAILQKLQSTSIYTLEFTLKNADGQIRSKQFRFCYIDQATKAILFTLTDFTDVVDHEKEQQELLQAALRAAEKANLAKSEFLSRMSHDMRTPMNGIIGLTNLTLELPELSDEVRKNLVSINDSSKYLLSLINDTLDMSRIESSKLTLNPEIINARQLVDNISTSIMPLMKEKQIDFRIITIDAQYIPIKADKVRFQQIFVNILSNAVKFTPAGGKIEWILQCLKRENNIAYDKFVVRDTGIGMSPEFLPKIFEPFEQEQNNGVSTYLGTGLGMPIVKNLVEKMGGSIEVHSTQGVGTEVIIYLHFERMADATQWEQAPVQTQVELGGRRILLCEDHPLNMQIACRLLEKKGVLVTQAENGQQGVDAFAASPPWYFDAILMDIRMPVLDGLSAARAIRAMDRPDAAHIPILAMTANAFEDDHRKSKAAGMDAHLTKPFDAQVFYQTLYEFITNRQERRDSGEPKQIDHL